MKLRNFKQIGSAAILTAVLALNSCQKEEVIAPKKTNTVSSVQLQNISFNKIEMLNEEVLKMIDVITEHSFKTEGILGCSVITVDSSSSPTHATIVFDPNCTDSDGNSWSGTMELYYNFADKEDFKATPTSHLEAHFYDVVKGSEKIDGSFTAHNTGHSGDFHNLYNFTANMTVVDQVSSDVTDLNGGFDIKYVRGYNTPSTKSDDMIERFGVMNGALNAEPFTISIDPGHGLLKFRDDANCSYYMQGIMDYTLGSNPTETIDYGTGECDNIATKTINGNSETITLD